MMSSKNKTQQKNILNTIISSVLPDNRPITALQIVEDVEKCPKNYHPIDKTYDQDQDADLWRESNIIFGKRTGRYLCLSKTEGLSEFIIESLKVIAEKETAPDGYTGLSKTADSEQKAWRKKQIVYRLSKRHQVTQAVTDIILCSKFKYAPEGFLTAGDINGVIICYKLTLVTTLTRELPALPYSNNNNNNSINNIGQQIENLKLHSKPLYPSPFDHEYENLRKSFQISPNRPAPKPPLFTQTSTLGPGHAAELEGVPFTLNPSLIDSAKQTFTLPTFNTNKLDGQLDYDFNLERQILCSTKIPLATVSAANLNSSANRNPFFN